MPLITELDELATWLQRLPSIGMQTLGGSGAPTYILDLVMIGAVKRSLNLASGMLSMVQAQNMVCSRAILRMQLDTVSRLLAYTYVKNPEEMAKALISGTPIKKFKSRDGKALVDGYLVDQMTKAHPWARKVYDFTSGYVHFSERQLFDSIHSVGSDQERTIHLQVSHVDDKFPEFSWEETVACFNELLKITESLLESYSSQKTANPSINPDAAQRRLCLTLRMNTPVATLDLTAHRSGSPSAPVQVRLFSPRLSEPPNTYFCLVEFHGLISENRRIYGEGSMQALCLAAQYAIQSLASFAEQEWNFTNTEGDEFDASVFGFRLLA